MTQPILPSGGGSYEREKDGSLTVIEQPEAAHDTATDASAEVSIEDLAPPAPEVVIDDLKPKAPRRVAADVKEA